MEHLIYASILALSKYSQGLEFHLENDKYKYVNKGDLLQFPIIQNEDI